MKYKKKYEKILLGYKKTIISQGSIILATRN
jgi:hypothetical protein